MRMLLQRLVAMVPVIVITTVVTFSLVFLIPGDPATRIAGEGASEAQVARVAQDLGLDQPAVVQYWSFLKGLASGDLGDSYTYGTSVSEMLVARLPVTFALTIAALVLASMVGITLGVVAGRKEGSIADRAVTVVTSLSLATPNFALGLILVMFLAIRNPWFPATDYYPMSDGLFQWAKHLLLPAVSLAVLSGAEIARQLRASLIEVLGQDYIRTNIASGLQPRRILWVNALKNAMLPTITVIGLQVTYLLGGTAVIESVFGINGLGDFAVQAVMSRDLPAIQGMVVFSVVITLIASLVVDVLYGALDPRIRRA